MNSSTIQLLAAPAQCGTAAAPSTGGPPLTDVTRHSSVDGAKAPSTSTSSASPSRINNDDADFLNGNGDYLNLTYERNRSACRLHYACGQNGNDSDKAKKAIDEELDGWLMKGTLLNDINLKSKHTGMTALNVAVKSGNAEVVDTLLKHGANAYITFFAADGTGKKEWSNAKYAEKHTFVATSKVLIKHNVSIKGILAKYSSISRISCEFDAVSKKGAIDKADEERKNKIAEENREWKIIQEDSNAANDEAEVAIKKAKVVSRNPDSGSDEVDDVKVKADTAIAKASATKVEASAACIKRNTNISEADKECEVEKALINSEWAKSILEKVKKIRKVDTAQGKTNALKRKGVELEDQKKV